MSTRPKKSLKSSKTKRVLFKIYVKYLNGSAPFSISMRNIDSRKEWKIVSSSNKSFTPAGNQWEALEFKCRIPDMEEISATDFQTGAINPPPGFECLVDEPSLEVIPDDKNAFFAPVFMGSAAKDNSPPLILVKDGKAAAAIVTEAKPTECVKYAVKELNDHIELCSGAKLPVMTEDQKFERHGDLYRENADCGEFWRDA